MITKLEVQALVDWLIKNGYIDTFGATTRIEITELLWEEACNRKPYQKRN